MTVHPSTLMQGCLNSFRSCSSCSQVYGCVSSKLELVHRKLKQDSHRARWPLYDWTDETDQMILILQSIVANQGEVSCHNEY
jgi:hypothetical protein